jgi:hypothetical protein
MDTTYLVKSAAELQNFLVRHPGEFDACLDQLKLFSKHNFKALHMESNPVISELSKLSKAQLEFIIREYSGFSNEAIHMLLDAMIRDHDWKKLYEEIQHNIDEEKGQETKGIPHLEMMRQGYKIELGIDTDNVQYSKVTSSFLKEMRRIFRHNDNAFSAGALLAFEGSAIAEFHILDAIVKEFRKKKGIEDENTGRSSLTKSYIEGHKDFEIGHEAHLVESIRQYIDRENINKMVRGYFAVCTTMNTWWEQLYLQSFQHIFSGLGDFVATDPELG